MIACHRLHSGRWKHHARSCCGTPSVHRRSAPIRAKHERVQLCRDPQTEFPLLRESLGVSRITSSGCMATKSCKKNGLLKSTLRWDRSPLKHSGVHGRQFGASNTQRRPVQDSLQKSAGHSRPSTPWSTHCSQTAHPGDDTRCSHSWPFAVTSSGDPPCCNH